MLNLLETNEGKEEIRTLLVDKFSLKIYCAYDARRMGGRKTRAIQLAALPGLRFIFGSSTGVRGRWFRHLVPRSANKIDSKLVLLRKSHFSCLKFITKSRTHRKSNNITHRKSFRLLGSVRPRDSEGEWWRIQINISVHDSATFCRVEGLWGRLRSQIESIPIRRSFNMRWIARKRNFNQS